MSFTLDANTLPEPTSVLTTENEIVRSARLSSGKLVKDVVATKRTIMLQYKDITDTDFDTLKTEYDKHIFQAFVYPEGSATVAWQTFPRRLSFVADNYRVYTVVNILLEEQ